MDYGRHPLDPTGDYNPDDYPTPPKSFVTWKENVMCAAIAAGILFSAWFFMWVL